MLDERTSLLLAAINEYCGEGSFKIAEEGELLRRFPAQMGVDGESLRAMLVYLGDRRYIDVRYAEEGEYCVRPLPEGRIYFERTQAERRESRRRRRDGVVFALIGSFAGGFFGALAAWLLTSIL